DPLGRASTRTRVAETIRRATSSPKTPSPNPWPDPAVPWDSPPGSQGTAWPGRPASAAWYAPGLPVCTLMEQRPVPIADWNGKADELELDEPCPGVGRPAAVQEAVRE